MRNKFVLFSLFFAFFVVSCEAPTASATLAPAKPTVTQCREKAPLAAGKYIKVAGEPIISVPIWSTNELGGGFFVETVPGKIFLATAYHVIKSDSCDLRFQIPLQKNIYTVQAKDFKSRNGKITEFIDAFMSYELPPDVTKEILALEKSGILRIFPMTNAPASGGTVYVPIANSGDLGVLRTESNRISGDDRKVAQFTDEHILCLGDSGFPIIDLNNVSVVGVFSAIDPDPLYAKKINDKICSKRIYFTPAIPAP